MRQKLARAADEFGRWVIVALFRGGRQRTPTSRSSSDRRRTNLADPDRPAVVSAFLRFWVVQMDDG
jgi:predicted alpha/beta hydrolase